MSRNYQDEDVDDAFRDGRILASPEPGDEVCITGISGSFPNSRNIQELRDNLINKIDMVDDDCRRWPQIHPEIPQRVGKIFDIEKFDAGFFGVHHRQADSMDPMLRILLEKVVEAVFDAGYHPSELEGTRTGVFVGMTFAESERDWFFINLEPQTFALTGATRNMMAHRISYQMRICGPSRVEDLACGSSLFCVDSAYRAIRTGQCDKAIVAAANLVLHPIMSLHYARAGVLSPDGRCKTFDFNGNGYARSEAVSAILLEKAKDSRRIYTSIVHSKTNCDGYKEQGLYHPSGESQNKLLKDFYKECNVDPSSLSYMEAHGTGTRVGDPEECAAFDDVFCEGRKEPLLIGSVKSNIGHTEAVSGLCSIVKCIIAMEEGYIPPNIHYYKPREGVKALEEGRLKVVSERMQFQDDRGLIGVSSFGIGGSNCHILLKWNPKLRKNDGQPKDDLPRLVCVSGRTPEAITAFTKDVNSRKLDAEYIQLLHEVFKQDIHSHLYRGFTITGKEGQVKASMRHSKGEKQPLIIVFGTFDNSWQSQTKSMLVFPKFSSTIRRIQNILSQADIRIDIMKIINNEAPNIHPVERNILGNVTLLIGIVEILQDLKLAPDLIIGHELGELGCAYFDGCLSLEQTLLTALEIARCVKTLNESSSKCLKFLPDMRTEQLTPTSIEMICKNDVDRVSISGPTKNPKKFVKPLEEYGVVDKHKSNSPFTWLHSKCTNIESALPKLKDIIPMPKKRSEKWISSSEDRFASPKYFINAAHAEKCFQTLSSRFEGHPVIFELGLGRFAEILKNTLKKLVKVVKFDCVPGNNGVNIFLEALGSLYEYGYNPQIQYLYPRVEYPVGRGTPMISPKIKWNHKQDRYVMNFRNSSRKKEEQQVYISTIYEEYQYLNGNIIDGRNIFPVSGHLQLIWDMFSTIKEMGEFEHPLVFENCCFKKQTIIGKEETVLNITIQRYSGNFEITEGESGIVNGRVYFLPVGDDNYTDLPISHQTSETIPMKKEDIYKELYFRGYNYKESFRGIESCNLEATTAWLKWDGNWVSFMENMLQLKLLNLDSRHLYVPTHIEKLTVDARYHMNYIETLGENPVLPVYFYKEADIIRCGGIVIKGLMVTAIQRRNPPGQLIVEKCEFVPNDLKFVSVEESIRINMQIGLENIYDTDVKVVELIDADSNFDPLAPLVHQVLSHQPLIQSKITILSKGNHKVGNLKVEDGKLASQSDCNMIIGNDILMRKKVLLEALGALKDNGFILSREKTDFDVSVLPKHDFTAIDILTIHHVGTEKLVYFKKTEAAKEFKIMNASLKDEESRWVSTSQAHLKNDQHVLIYSQNEDHNGVLGLFHSVRREPWGKNARCFIILDEEAPPFDPKSSFYAEHLKKNISVNIYKNGQWGTYRHLLLGRKIEDEIKVDSPTIRWTERNLNLNMVPPPGKKLIQIYYSSINLRDIMIASGEIHADLVTKNRISQENLQGFEFSGQTSDGRRVMGMSYGAFSSIITADSSLLWDIPDCWTLQQAATIPVVYGTVLYALIMRIKIRKGQSILIHSGTGGIGQAAINVALHYGCTVFTTVGTQEKRKFIKKLFPQLTDCHIGDSRDTTFEELIKQNTNGRGVNIILNSLAGEQLLASARCLAKGGNFLEVGKLDIANNTNFMLSLLSKGCSFHGINLDLIFNSQPSLKKTLNDLLIEGIKNGAVKPLNTNVFKIDELEEAYRFMTEKKHMGKVMIQVRKEEAMNEAIAPVIINEAHLRFHCDEEKSQIILEGNGVFGLELADWLVLRGAKKLILSTRNEIRSGFQSYRVNLWKSYGVDVHICNADVNTEEGCKQLIAEAQKIGPVESIFNLIVDNNDSLVDQSPERFRITSSPKAVATKILDMVTRMKCKDLRNFVIFSYNSNGRENSCHTNIMTESVVRSVCERRILDGYPALTIEWGTISDIDIEAEMIENDTSSLIDGRLPRKISSCLHLMDTFLTQKEAAVVSSMVLPTKKSSEGGSKNIVEAVLQILGLKKQSVSPHTTLAELGMDSMSLVEINDTLKRDFEMELSAQDIRNMTLAKLQESQQPEKCMKNKACEVKQKSPTGIDNTLRSLESKSMTPVLRQLSLSESDTESSNVFCFPGIEGCTKTFKPLTVNLRAKVIGLEFPYEISTISFSRLAEEAVVQIEKLLKPNEPLNIIAYSWGSIIAMEALALFERKGIIGNIICLDSAPSMIQEMCKQDLKNGLDGELEGSMFSPLIGSNIADNKLSQNKDKVHQYKGLKDDINVTREASTNLPQNFKDIKAGFSARIKELMCYSPNYLKIQSPVRLYKAEIQSVQNFADDYKLSDMCANLKEVKIFKGTHVTIVENIEVAEAINVALGLKAPFLLHKSRNG